MLNRISAALICAGLLLPATGTFASGDIVLTPEIEQTIRTTLTEQGYEVAKIKTEDGFYEAYAKKDGKKLEIFLNEEFEIDHIED